MTVNRYRMQGDYLQNVVAELTTDDHRNLNAIDGDRGEWIRGEDYDALVTAVRKVLAFDAVRCAWDCGPRGEGWPSNELNAAMCELELLVSVEGKT